MGKFENGDRVKHTKWGNTGTVHMWEESNDEIGNGEVRWDGTNVADELDLVADNLVRHTDK